jgi:hypothetical protein
MHNRRSSVLGTRSFALFFFALTGCSSSSTGSPTTTDGGDAGGFQHEIVVSMELTVKSGAELHTCELVALPNDKDVNVVSISHEYTAGSHHFLLFETDLDAIPPDLDGQFDCVQGDEPIMQHARGVLFAAQSPRGDFPFPAGVGLELKAHQVVMLQAHYLNPTRQDLDAKVKAGFDTAPLETTPNRAGFMILYDPFIYLPPQASASSGLRCSVPSPITLFAASTHYHQRGTGMRVWVDPSISSPTAAPFFETHDWEHAPNFTDHLAVDAGSLFRFQCDYFNADAVDVFQGPNAATSEMCVFGALYYPKIDGEFEHCADLSVIGTGTKSCYDQLQCIQSCPPGEAPVQTHGGVNVGPCWEKCITAGCAGATDLLLPATRCIGNMCQAECAAGDCSSCAVSKCATFLDPCIAQSCTLP